jgi:opacity protein-like surface antigen
MQQFVGDPYNGLMACSDHFATFPEADPPIREEYIMKKILALATFAALCAAQPAVAGDTGFYVGADIGQISADIDKGDLDSLVNDALEFEGLTLEGSSDLDDSDMTYGLTVGYKFMPYFAVEGQYLDLGEAKYTVGGEIFEGPEFLGTADVSTSINSSGFALSVLGILPIQEVWEVYARLGMYFGDTEADLSAAADGDIVLSGSESKSEEEFFYGIGGGYTFNETWNVRVEYTIFPDIGDKDLTGEADVDRLVIGVNYMF